LQHAVDRLLNCDQTADNHGRELVAHARNAKLIAQTASLRPYFTANSRRNLACERRQPNIALRVVDNLQHARPEWRIFDGKLAKQATVVEEISRVSHLGSVLMLETDAGVGLQ
jgi:hypothetical protein